MNAGLEILASVDLSKARHEAMTRAYRALCDRVIAGHPYALAAEAVGLEMRHELTRDERRLLCMIRDASTPDSLKTKRPNPIPVGERPWERLARLEAKIGARK